MERSFHRVVAGRAGFTLVELVTVIAILGILVTLSVGAIQAVQHAVAANATRQMFRALEAALSRYYEDWGAYPYTANVTDPFDPSRKIMGQVDTASADSPFKAVTSITLADDFTADEKKRAFVLYVGVNLNRRKGPYFEGTGSSVVQVPAASGTPITKFFPAYVDGWGRMIMYKWPASSDVPPESRLAKPLLTSKGVRVADDGDNLNNYRD